ncbi:MAG TPA: DUF6176 family protein [Vicinamibacteria bacterium]|jgi:hypothetical protein
MKALVLLLAGGVAGSLATYASLSAQPSEPLNVVLYRFELQPEKLDRFEEWARFEHAHHQETLETLEREKTVFEAIFRDREREKDVIYWLAIREEGGATVETSPSPSTPSTRSS